MSGNAKFRFLLAPIVVALLVVVTSPVSWAGELEDAEGYVRRYPNDDLAHKKLGLMYLTLSHRIRKDWGNPNRLAEAKKQLLNAIASFEEALRINPKNIAAHNLAFGAKDSLKSLKSTEESINKRKKDENVWREYLEKRQKPEGNRNRQEDPRLAEKNRQLEEERKKLEEEKRKLEEERKKLKALRLAESNRQRQAHFERKPLAEKSSQLEEERKKLEEERKKLKALRLAEEKRQRQAQAEKESTPRKEQAPQSGTGSGFFVSKMGHVITNAHVVQNCKKVTIGDNANKQVPAELINTDKSNDLALLKLSTLEMASTESKSLIQKLGIVVVPLASKGLLRSEDVRLGEKILVAGYPFGDAFSNSIKVTTGVVSSIRGVGDDSGQFQLDAAVQPGNSGGPIYDSSGNIVGVVISQLNKRTFGSLVENVNFGVKASTVRQFLVSSGLSSKKAERTEEKSTEQLAEIAQNQALMVMCLQ